jgi:two-component system response regulator DegU
MPAFRSRMEKQTIKIAIADDHEFVRKAICSYIPSLGPSFKIVAEASDGISLLDIVEKHKPDLVILDLEMPNLNGFEVLKQLKAKTATQGIKVIVLSAHYNEFFFKELVVLGAASYLPKNCTSAEFVKTVQEVLKDGFSLPQAVTQEIVTDVVNDNRVHTSGDKRLSEREIEVIELLCQGFKHKEIADKLKITTWTVRYHMKSIYRKTRQHNSAAVVKYAVRAGIINVESSFNPKLTYKRYG